VTYPRGVNEKRFASGSKVVELTGFVERRYHADVGTADASGWKEEAGPERASDESEWDEVFAWSYGQGLWNVGCG
jgi:hypothetical protein